VSLITSYSTLVTRDFKSVIRNPLMVKSRFFQTTILYIYIGGLFYHISGNYTNPTDWHAITGFLFFISLNTFMISLVPITLVFPTER
jgi:hypothetical protein